MRLLATLLGSTALALLLSRFSTAPNDVEAGTALRMDVPELARRSDLIVEARVLSKQALEAGGGRIETEYLLAVERTLAGEPLALRAIRLPGGVLPDGRGMLLSGMPALRVGESVLLFLTRASETGMRMPVGLAQGKLSVVWNAAGEKLLVRDTSGMALAQVSSGAVREANGVSILSYVDALAAIEAARAKRTDKEAR
jgi:hypothetical protein